MAVDRERFAITFTSADPHDPPTIQRVRRMLKAALRSYGLRCVDIREVTPKPALATEHAR